MPHDHGHHHAAKEIGDKRRVLAEVINVGLTVAQVVGGILSGSLALIADALKRHGGSGHRRLRARRALAVILIPWNTRRRRAQGGGG